jgi:hypothetical protein
MVIEPSTCYCYWPWHTSSPSSTLLLLLNHPTVRVSKSQSPKTKQSYVSLISHYHCALLFSPLVLTNSHTTFSHSIATFPSLTNHILLTLPASLFKHVFFLTRVTFPSSYKFNPGFHHFIHIHILSPFYFHFFITFPLQVATPKKDKNKKQ